MRVGFDIGGTFTDIVIVAADGQVRTSKILSVPDQIAAEVALALYERVRGLLPSHGAEELKTLGDGLLLRCERPAPGIALAVRIVEKKAAAAATPATPPPAANPAE